METKEFTDLIDFLQYAYKNMPDAVRRHSTMAITIKDSKGELIGEWDFSGKGYINEKREENRE